MTVVTRIDDAKALDRINDILSQPEWYVSMLEDICRIVRDTGRDENPDPPEYERH